MISGPTGRGAALGRRAPVGSSPAAAFARRLIEERRRRGQALGADMFGEPAWDMLLLLFLANEEGRHVSVSALCAELPAPATTAHRWMLLLVEKGLLVRIGDRQDRRRSFVYLSAEGARRMGTLLAAFAAGRTALA